MSRPTVVLAWLITVFLMVDSKSLRADVWGSVSADPYSFHHGDIITVSASASGQPPSWCFEGLCWAQTSYTEITGSDGSHDRIDCDYCGNDAPGLSLVDSIPGQTMESTTYTAHSAICWYSEDTGGCNWEDDYQFVTVNPAPPTITGPNTVWWFNGESPSGYATAITLTADSGDSTQWEIVDGSDKVNLSAGSGAEITLTSTGGAFSSASNDIRIRATSSGLTGDFTVTSRTPNRLIPFSQGYRCDDTYGYFAHVDYVIQDQLQTDLPAGVPLNENWTTGVVTDYSGQNWRRSDPAAYTSDVAAFSDGMYGEYPGLPAVPQPTCDGNSQPVQHFGQAWNIGSEVIGAGMEVQTNTLQRLLGRALHTNIVSPVR
jgi:hypothetical protein